MKTRIFLCLAALVLLMGCKKATVLESDVESLTVPISGQTDTIRLSSDVNDFKLESFPEWTQTELTDSVLVVKVGKNDSKGERKGEIVVTNGDLKLTIPVVQQFKATHLDLPDGDSISFGKEGGSQTLAVSCDGNVSVEAPEGMQASYADGVLTVSVPENTGGSVKNTIVLTADEFSKEVSVSIEGSICPTCKGSGKIRCKSCGGKGYIDSYRAILGCEKCGGRGGSTYEGDFNYREGSGKQACPTCGGKGS